MNIKVETILSLVTAVLVAGALVLAIIDPATRSAFNDLAQTVLGIYMGLLIQKKG